MIDVALFSALRPTAQRLAGRGIWSPSLDVEDLAQAGAVGVLEAARRFRASGGASLRTFTRHRMVGAMRDALRAADLLTREQRAAVRAGDAAFLLLPLEAASRVPAPGLDPDAARLVAELLQLLSPRQRFVLEQHYLHGVSIRAIARVCRVTPGRISQVKSRALAHLRRKVAA